MTDSMRDPWPPASGETARPPRNPGLAAFATISLTVLAALLVAIVWIYSRAWDDSLSYSELRSLDRVLVLLVALGGSLTATALALAEILRRGETTQWYRKARDRGTVPPADPRAPYAEGLQPILWRWASLVASLAACAGTLVASARMRAWETRVDDLSGGHYALGLTVGLVAGIMLVSMVKRICWDVWRARRLRLPLEAPRYGRSRAWQRVTQIARIDLWLGGIGGVLAWIGAHIGLSHSDPGNLPQVLCGIGALLVVAGCALASQFYRAGYSLEILEYTDVFDG